MSAKVSIGLVLFGALTLALYFGLVALSPDVQSPNVKNSQGLRDPKLTMPSAKSLSKDSASKNDLTIANPKTSAASRSNRPRMSDQQLTVPKDEALNTRLTEKTEIALQEQMKANERIVVLASVRNEMKHVMRNGAGAINIDELDQVLVQLQSVGDEDGTFNGIDIDPLRHTLATVASINVVNAKIKAAAENPNNIDYESINGYLVELQILQQSLQPAAADTSL